MNYKLIIYAVIIIYYIPNIRYKYNSLDEGKVNEYLC